jgi:hypothetical protein
MGIGDELYGPGGEGGVLGSGCGGEQGVETAIELVCHDIAADGNEGRPGLHLMHRIDGGVEQDVGCIDALGIACGLQLVEVGCLGRRGRGGKDLCPARDWKGTQLGRFSGVVEGIEVDVRKHDDAGSGLLLTCEGESGCTEEEKYGNRSDVRAEKSSEKLQSGPRFL